MKKFFYILVAAGAVAACTPKEAFVDTLPASSAPKSVTATIESDVTRVFQEGLSLFWDKNDQISVFAEDGAYGVYSFAGEQGAKAGTFDLKNEGEATVAHSANYAVFPVDIVSGIDENGTLSVTLNEDQSSVEVDRIDTHYSNILVAKSDDTSFNFKNACGFLKASFYSSEPLEVGEIDLLALGGEPISGAFTVTFDADGLPVMTPGENVVEYSYKDFVNTWPQSKMTLGDSESSALDLYFIIPPGVYESGFAFYIYENTYADGDPIAMVAVTQPVTIYRNKVTSFPVRDLSVSVEPEFEVEKVDSWSVSYDGRENGYDWILVEGWTGEYYDVAVYGEGALAYFEGDIEALMKFRHNSYVGNYLANYTMDQLCYTQATWAGFQALDPGNYEVYLFDYTSEGELTGKYTSNTFTIEEPEEGEPTDAYKALFGVYNLSATGYHSEYDNGWTYPNSEVNIEGVIISQDVANVSYKVSFPEWDEDDQQYYYYTSIFDWDSETGALSASCQKIDSWTHSSYGAVEDWQYGYIWEPDDAAIYYVTGYYTILESEGFKNGVITCNPGPALELSDGSTYDIAGLDLIGALTEYAGGGYSFTYMQIPLPATLTRVSDLPAETSAASVRRLAPTSPAKAPLSEGKALKANISVVNDNQPQMLATNIGVKVDRIRK